LNRAILSLTKLYLRSRKAKFRNISRIRLPDNREVEVVVYASNGDFLLGQATITGAIIVHEMCFSHTELLYYVVAHEDAHRRSWYSYLALPLIIVLWPYGLFAVGSSLFYLGAAVSSGDYNILSLFFGMLIIGLIAIAIGCFYSWFIEYKADRQAIRVLGMDTVLHAREEIGRLPKLSLSWRIIARMTHPPFSLTKRIYQFFNGKD
jgi:Zn-dependent protease with chaperone function